MASQRAKRWGLIAFVAFLALTLGAVIGFRTAVGFLKDRVVEALGPNSEIRELKIGWFTVELKGLRIKGPDGWPVSDTLRAERVVIFPSLRTLLSDEIRIRSITVVRPYISAVRTRDGKLRIVPSLLAPPGPKEPEADRSPTQSVTVSKIKLKDGVIELFDATIGRRPLKIRLEQIQASVRNVVAPELSGRSRFDLAGIVKGIRRDGRANVTGWIEVASKDSSVKTELRAIDLVAVQPYLIGAAETQIQKGTFDLTLNSEVRKRKLHAEGRAVISDMEFAPAGAKDTFMGVPRAAVVNFLENKDDRIDLDFVIEGDIDHPSFSLNESIATRIASALAKNLGVNIRGMVEGLGGLGRKGVESAGEAAKGVGGALKQLFGGQKKK